MTLFERKAIDWLNEKYSPLDSSDESYYAYIILKLIEGLGDQSVSDLLSRIDELEGEVERLKDILDDVGAVYSECEV